MSEIKIGRVASSNPTGLKAVKGYNRPAGNSMADIFKSQGIDPDALKRSLTTKPSELTGRELLNQQITARMGQNPQFGGKTVKVGDKFVAQTAAETKAAAEAAQAGRQAKAQVEQILSKPAQVTAESIEAGLGIGRQAKSAQESAGVFVKDEVRRALSKPTQVTAEGIDAALGIGKAPKSAAESMGVFVKEDIEQISQRARFNPSELGNIGMANGVKSAEESAQVFIENGVGETVKKKGIFGKIGDFFKGIGNKIGSIWKSGPMGKIGLIAGGVALLGALGYGLYKLFGGNNDKKADTATGLPANPQHPEVEKPEETPETPAVVPPADEEEKPEETPETPAVVPPANEEEKPEETPETPAVVPPANEEENDPNIHTVVDGECPWTIAKHHLEELNKDKDHKVTNKEILDHTKEIMKWNNLHFEKDNYTVIIHTGDKLRLTAPEEEKEEKAEKAE